jgi:hypothetical protein
MPSRNSNAPAHALSHIAGFSKTTLLSPEGNSLLEYQSEIDLRAFKRCRSTLKFVGVPVAGEEHTICASNTGPMMPRHGKKSLASHSTSSRRHAVPAIFGEGNDGDHHGETFGDWLVNVAICTTGKGDRNRASERLEKVYGSGFSPWRKAALAESSGTTGGYTVPPDFYPKLPGVVLPPAEYQGDQAGKSASSLSYTPRARRRPARARAPPYSFLFASSPDRGVQ